MKLWVTEIKAIDPRNGELATWAGPNVPGINWQDASDYLQRNGLGYCYVIGELISEIPSKEDGISADWIKKIDYDIIRSN